MRSFVLLISLLTLAQSIAFTLQASDLVRVDANKTVVDAFMGFGVQWDPYDYPPSPESWALMLRRLDYCKPAFFRVMWRADAYCDGFDANGSPKYVWNQGEATAKKRLSQLFAILDYARSHHIDVMLGEWANPRNMPSDDGKILRRPDDPRWARIVADFVTYLTTQRKYTVIKYYNLFNEPNGGWMWPGGKVDYDAWAKGIRHLRKELDARDLGSLPIVGPDNSNNWEWLDRCAREMPGEFGHWEMHWYVMDRELIEGRVEELLSTKRRMLMETDPKAASKLRFMGEAGIFEGRCHGDQQPRVKIFKYGVLMADFMAQIAGAGWMGASAWDLDDAMHCVKQDHRPVPPDDLTLKIWGFWNTQGAAMGHPEDEKIRPWFYTWSLMSRLFPPGCRIVGTELPAELPAFRVMAMSKSENGRNGLSIMLVNDADLARTVTLQVKGVPPVATLQQFDYFADDRPVDKDGFPVPKQILQHPDLGSGISVTLPSRGVIFLTNLDPK